MSTDVISTFAPPAVRIEVVNDWPTPSVKRRMRPVTRLFGGTQQARRRVKTRAVGGCWPGRWGVGWTEGEAQPLPEVQPTLTDGRFRMIGSSCEVRHAGKKQDCSALD